MSQSSAPSSSSSIRIKPGDTLGGKYHIERVLGQGCMGVVMAARHVHLDERVAIKFMLPEVLDNTEHVGRFIREARAAAKIKNEHVARVMDVEVMPGGQPYIVMEYLEGQDLGAMLEKDGPLQVSQAIDHILEACDALGEAHSLGIVHRDFKPANVFLARRSDGKIVTKILDFGISKMKASDMAMTSTVALMGSPAYMSPEQMLSSRDVDPRTDIWAVGVTLYQLLTARLPFSGTTVPEVCARVLNTEPPALRSVRPDVSPDLEAVVMRCLVKNRDYRFQNVAALVAALAPFGSGRISVASHPGGPGPTGSHPTSTLPASFPETGGTNPVWGNTLNGEARRASSRRRFIIAGTTIVALAAVVLATLALRENHGGAQRTGNMLPVSAAPGDPTAVPVNNDNPVAAPAPTADKPAAGDPSANNPPPADTQMPSAAERGTKPGASDVGRDPAITRDTNAWGSEPWRNGGRVRGDDNQWGGAQRKPATRPKPAAQPKKTPLPSNEDLFSEPK